MKIIISEQQLQFLIEQQEQGDFTTGQSTQDSTEDAKVNEIPNCYNILRFIDDKITEMKQKGESDDRIGQILASNVKLESLSQERQNQLDPYNILRSDIVKNLKSKKGSQSILRMMTDCTKDYFLNKNMIKNKDIFRKFKIKVIEMPHGGGDGLTDAQCGRPKWGKASRSCMKPIFSGPHGITFGGMRAK